MEGYRVWGWVILIPSHALSALFRVCTGPGNISQEPGFKNDFFTFNEAELLRHFSMRLDLWAIDRPLNPHYIKHLETPCFLSCPAARRAAD